MLGLPMGWAALGGFEAVLVDNGGPYRSRLETMATLLAGGSLLCVIGAILGGSFWLSVMVTAAVCFATTFARVASERIASTSVIILVLYFAGFGGTDHSYAHACAAALEFVLGGIWAAALSLVLWPVDPFRPARREVAECYTVLAEFSGKMLVEEWAKDRQESHLPRAGHGAPGSSDTEEERRISKEHTGHFQRAMRLQMEKARHAVGRVPARMTARTVRARNLSVLLETADMLFAITMRWRELAEVADDPASFAALREAARWLSGAEWAISRGLRLRPGDGAASYLPEGSHSMEHVRPRLKRPRWPFAKGTARAHLAADERDALDNVQIAFEAVRAVWSGVELPLGGAAARWEIIAQEPEEAQLKTPNDRAMQYRWMDALRANWTFESVMLRHALRMAVVGGADILLMRLTHVRHGSWLAMTSIIVLQPYGSGTLRRGLQRVGGTIAGGVLAAILATAIHGQAGLIAAVTVVAALTLATYAVNYAWYCFFLTPTFVLMSMPNFRDWSYAEVRIANTLLGALVAVFAMRLLWPEREHLELSRLLGRGASADAGYLRAMMQYWRVPVPERATAERQLLAPARRLAGLAINDAEESLDRMMLEPGFGKKTTSGDIQAEALTFVTYLRRLMRVATTLTMVGVGSEKTATQTETMIARLERMSGALLGSEKLIAAVPSPPDASSKDEGQHFLVEEGQMRRMERQVGVLERTAAELLGKRSER
jgi:uncharacterized membrane protein YccC